MRRFSLREDERARTDASEATESVSASSPASSATQGLSPRKKFKIKLLMLGDSGSRDRPLLLPKRARCTERFFVRLM